MPGLDRYRKFAGLPMPGGYPTAEASALLDDELFFQRAVQVYLWALPAMNMYAMKRGLGALSGGGYQVMSVFEQRLKPSTLITTPNSDVIYGLAFADLAATGPLVVEVPPHVQGLVDDFWHRPLTGPVIDGRQYLGDIGIPGPDHGDGGRYLIVPQGMHDQIDTAGYFAYTCPTNGVFIFMRGFFTDIDDLKPGVAAVEGITIRPLAGPAQPMQFRHVSDLPADALFPADGSYFDLLAEFVQGEQLDAVDPYMHGVAAALGIVKGSAYAPSAHQRELLDLAARTGWRMAKNIAGNFDREHNALWWADRHWVAHAKTEQDDFWHTLLDEQWRDRSTGHNDVNAKAHMFVNAYSISTGMMSSIPGMGAKYAAAYKDSGGQFLHGDRTYRIDLPAGPPVNLFWSVTLYDAETAAGVDVDVDVDVDGQTYPSLNSMNDLVCNDDGSVTLWIGPDGGGGPNLLRTVPGRGWFSLIRWYGPTEAFFDRQYTPGDFVRAD
ncbi:DUF1254 domain-containing protein [Catellatospora chokoriensis]|uniref:CDP-4-dehydro-6-deoxy-D-glucose 3-dehydratase n=1 Tax=Catellatospora chokoriensis TaxID=310353 RepID=A0A8J3NSA2_9ACTN|nr:DUF1254 domain-containing protein [Catellatospora chokoriensis]GIF90326.1 CDP-4-dehydro-6-deoxy-D-glucose 3-dehydratase [Catellatospora chokoriensis]